MIYEIKYLYKDHVHRKIHYNMVHLKTLSSFYKKG